jgi:hypothetical protein
VIKERIRHPLVHDIPIERIQLQIEGGDYLKKNSTILEDAGVKDRSNLLVSISDKPVGGAGGATGT